MALTRRAFGLGVLGTLGLLCAGVPIAWTAVDEARFLDAAVDAFFPPDDGLPTATEVGAAAAIARYLARLPTEVAWQARGLFRVVEYSTLPTHGARFSSLDRAARTEVLAAMASSDLAGRRLLAQALKETCAMGYWQHDATWGALGYDGPLVGRRP